MSKKVVQRQLKNLPKTPGVYIFRDAKGKILYIGKAARLKDRVSSYFLKAADLAPKIQNMVHRIGKIDFVETRSEAEALVLESELIRRNKPSYNTDWKDDKNYLYIKISAEKFPQISLVRRPLDDSSTYFGPFVDAGALRKTLRFLRKIFPYRDKSCQVGSGKPCFYYHLGLCPGTCVGEVSEKDYKKNIKKINLFFKGKLERIVKELGGEMNNLSRIQNFEAAARVRDQIENLKRAGKVKIFEEKTLKEDKALFGLAEVLDIKIPKRIECFDISDIKGTGATGSMVVFENGLSKKLDYRRFKIKTVKKIDDYAMMGEVLRRRFSKVDLEKDESFSHLPDLVMIDGGKGHLSSVLKVFSELGIDIPTCALAKRQEELIRVKSLKFRVKSFKSIFLPPDSETLFLIQRIRDEAHRFALSYHVVLREKKVRKSILDEIPGVGSKTKKKLLKEFGSVARIRETSIEKLKNLVSEKLARKIKEYL